MKTHPVKKYQFDSRRQKLLEPSLIHSIDGLFEVECEIVVAAYHGSDLRAGLHFIRKGASHAIHSAYWRAVYRVCDWIGWTQLRPIPDTDFFRRHSAQCDKLNCDDIDCVTKGIPAWYQRLTRMDRFE